MTIAKKEMANLRIRRKKTGSKITSSKQDWYGLKVGPTPQSAARCLRTRNSSQIYSVKREATPREGVKPKVIMMRRKQVLRS